MKITDALLPTGKAARAFWTDSYTKLAPGKLTEFEVFTRKGVLVSAPVHLNDIIADDWMPFYAEEETVDFTEAVLRLEKCEAKRIRPVDSIFWYILSGESIVEENVKEPVYLAMYFFRCRWVCE